MKKFLSKAKNYFLAPKDKRPLWFIDAKWVCALLFVVFFATSLTSYNVMQLTNRDRAVGMLTDMIETSLDQAEGDILAKIKDYQASLQADKAATEEETESETKSDSMIGKALNLFFPEQDILNLSAADLKNGLLENLAVPIYEEGSSYVFTLLKGIDYASPIDNTLNKIPIYSDETHDNLMAAFVTTFVLSMISLAGLIYFSWRWGKIFNPGLVITISTAPGYFGYGYAHRFIKDFVPDVAVESSNFFINLFVVGIVETLEKNLKAITTFQTTWFWIGIALIIAAVVIKIYFVYRKRHNKAPSQYKPERKNRPKSKNSPKPKK